MTYLPDLLRFVHVAAGAIGLIAFWIPVFSSKGARTHVRFGKIFVRAAYVALGAAALALALRLIDLNQRNVSISDAPQMYEFVVFLGYLTLVTWVTVRHGMAVLRHKGTPEALRTLSHIGLAWTAIAASVGIVSYALILNPPSAIVLYALSPIGIATGIGNLRYINASTPSRRAWWYEHLGAMLGAGVAFHTAFAVFGMTRLFDIGLTGWVSAVPWVLPTAVGIPAIAIWTRHFRRKFGELA